MNRLPSRKPQGRRDILAITLLVVPLVALGYYLAVIEVAVDPPPDPAGGSTPTVVSTPAAGPGGAPTDTASPAIEDAPATPAPGAAGVGFDDPASGRTILLGTERAP